MANPQDQYEEAKVRFLREAVRGTECAIGAAAGVVYIKRYQSNISDLKKSLRELSIHEAAKDNRGKTMVSHIIVSLYGKRTNTD